MRRLTIALTILGAVFLTLGGPLLYLRHPVFDARGFADRATSALDSNRGASGLRATRSRPGRRADRRRRALTPDRLSKSLLMYVADLL